MNEVGADLARVQWTNNFDLEEQIQQLKLNLTWTVTQLNYNQVVEATGLKTSSSFHQTESIKTKLRELKTYLASLEIDITPE